MSVISTQGVLKAGPFRIGRETACKMWIERYLNNL